MARIESHMALPNSRRIAGQRIARPFAVLVAIVSVSFALGACSKCDVPDWIHKNAPQGPQSCHDTPPPQ